MQRFGYLLRKNKRIFANRIQKRRVILNNFIGNCLSDRPEQFPFTMITIYEMSSCLSCLSSISRKIFL